MGAPFIRTGGVGFFGGARIGSDPSPPGTWRPDLNEQSVSFDRDAFTRVIADNGYNVIWQKAALCPNIPGTYMAPKDHAISCTICDQSGFVYFDDCQTLMLMQGIKFEQSYYAYGRWDYGQMLVTAMPEYQLNYFDRLTLLNGSARFTERLTRTPGSTSDQCKYAPLCINYLAWVNRSGVLQTYTQDQDFQISADGLSVQWLITTGLPDDNSYYTVVYTYHPRYVVLDLLHHHRDQTSNQDPSSEHAFPVQAIAKLDFLLRDQGKDSAQVVDQNPFPR